MSNLLTSKLLFTYDLKSKLVLNKYFMKYDLEDRTTEYGEKIIDFAKTLPINIITKSIISQLVRSGTSIGANYREANEASSKKYFRNKIYISKKESNETKHWLQLITRALPETHKEAKILWNEAHEYTLIFGKIIHSLSNDKKPTY